jgi:predicted transcriptional regulator with HTH domain
MLRQEIISLERQWKIKKAGHAPNTVYSEKQSSINPVFGKAVFYHYKIYRSNTLLHEISSSVPMTLSVLKGDSGY